ncbi:xanthine phosphoribosyltransferase [Hydrogenispora ethanolica]|uniref:Xanthine phosphoribosyltransferase n=1 Tax=Hydrogenispora ethanolica TaxID=1082276 RepID=A0A4R1S1W2_HYDET|nr:xanthine phosphoribosyltransferase [Hydrogenispora ethanolica]TCL73146.1 xanthine phosphoribosyltransferase [Hydrogenispora ethanolica]
MQLLKDMIVTKGRVDSEHILKVDGFLNHQIDVQFLNEIGKEFKERFKDQPVTKILTIEASGIAVACMVAQYFEVPVIFAKKTESKNLDAATYESQVYSFTKDRYYKIRVSKRYLGSEDKVLIIDDFLANGQAVLGLKEIVDQAGAELVGVGIVIEKGFQQGGKLVRDQGIRVESLAIIESMKPGEVVFRP